MKPAAFDYARPPSLDAVLALLAEGRPDTKIIAGGQSLVPMMNYRLARPALLIDVNRIAGLDAIRVEGGELVIGAMARHRAVKESRIVAEAAPIVPVAYEWVAHSTVRNRGTIGGNLCHADPASEMPMVMLALDAVMVARSVSGERRIPADAFFVGLYETALRADEMLVEVRIPVVPRNRGFGFHEMSLRKGDFAFAAAGALVSVTGGRIDFASVAVGGVSDRARRLTAAEAALRGTSPTPQAIEAAVDAALDGIDVVGDLRAPADYRRSLARSLATRAISDALSTSI